MASTTSDDWIGATGDAWADEWRRTDRSLAGLTGQFVVALEDRAPLQGRALDIGCGAGEICLRLAALRPELQVVGADLSPGLAAVASARSAAVANVTVRVGDAVAVAADQAPLDLLVSRHGVMFFPDAVQAFTALRAAARPGAPLVFSCFRDWSLNGFYAAIAARFDLPPPEPRAPGPFAFADADHVAAVLDAAGWRSVSAQRVDFTYGAGEGDDPVEDAASFLSRIGPAARMIRTSDPARRAGLQDRLRALLAEHADAGAVDFPAAAWIWSATA